MIFKTILDYEANKYNAFISDIRLNPVLRKKVLYDLLNIEDDFYPLSDWQETIRYLIGTLQIFTDIKSIKKYVSIYLEELKDE